jgi:thiol-disulfide isomerase/thioredoxin
MVLNGKVRRLSVRPRVPRVALLAAAGLVAVGIVSFVLYGIGGRDVHEASAPGVIPKVLDKLTPSKGTPAVGEASFTDRDGKPVQLSDYRGQTVVLNFWATWCAPCVKELPALAKAKQALEKDNVAVIAVDLEDQDPGKVAAFLEKTGAGALPVLVDRKLSMMSAFGAYGLPLTIIIDVKGREIARALGPQEWADPSALAYLRGLAEVRS